MKKGNLFGRQREGERACTRSDKGRGEGSTITAGEGTAETAGEKNCSREHREERTGGRRGEFYVGFIRIIRQIVIKK